MEKMNLANERKNRTLMNQECGTERWRKRPGIPYTYEEKPRGARGAMAKVKFADD